MTSHERCGKCGAVRCGACGGSGTFGYILRANGDTETPECNYCSGKGWVAEGGYIFRGDPFVSVVCPSCAADAMLAEREKEVK